MHGNPGKKNLYSIYSCWILVIGYWSLDISFLNASIVIILIPKYLYFSKILRKFYPNNLNWTAIKTHDPPCPLPPTGPSCWNIPILSGCKVCPACNFSSSFYPAIFCILWELLFLFCVFRVPACREAGLREIWFFQNRNLENFLYFST